jgi:predicted NUDIX family NTP pyrophosphohydrolase
VPSTPKKSPVSAGLLLFRIRGGRLELFLAHPGGPFWAKRDPGAWTIPKGQPNDGEELIEAAQREFEEETGIRPHGEFLPLGSIRQRAGKTVHAWAWEGDADASTITSITMKCEWPRGSGRWVVVPEIDRCQWFDPMTARSKINEAQRELIDRLELTLLDRRRRPMAAQGDLHRANPGEIPEGISTRGPGAA